MVPNAIHTLPALPVTLNGKLDRKRLEKLALEATEATPAHFENGVPPQRDISTSEQAIRDAWATALNRPASSISLDVDFYSSGGDSISCIHVAAFCRSAGYSLSIMDFADAPTISTQAQLVELRPRVLVAQAVYHPFDLLVHPEYRQGVEKEAASYGYKSDDIEDAYPSPPSVAGLISLAAGNPLVCMSETIRGQC